MFLLIGHFKWNINVKIYGIRRWLVWREVSRKESSDAAPTSHLVQESWATLERGSKSQFCHFKFLHLCWWSAQSSTSWVARVFPKPFLSDTVVFLLDLLVSHYLRTGFAFNLYQQCLTMHQTIHLVVLNSTSDNTNTITNPIQYTLHSPNERSTSQWYGGN